MKITVNRESVCLGDDINDHSKIYELSDTATYEDLFSALIKDKYFPNISGNNVVWVLTAEHFECIFSYFTKTNKFSAGLSEKHLKKLCTPSYEVFLRYYSSPEKWKNKIHAMYNHDGYALWHDGWEAELNYCDYATSLGMK